MALSVSEGLRIFGKFLRGLASLLTAHLFEPCRQFRDE